MKVGIQLYSVRKTMKDAPIPTIKKVVDAGYKYLEVANHHADVDDGVGFGVSAKEMNKILKDSGAQVKSAHIYPFNDDMYKKIIAYNLEIGNKTIVYPMEFYRNHKDVLRIAERCEKLGKIASEEGMQFLYHNHFHEFQMFDGESVMDTIVKNTDPSHVNLELDTFWTMRAGLDPFGMIKHFGTRIKMLHQKDMSKDTKTPVNLFDVVGKDTYIDMNVFHNAKCNDDFIEVGYGSMDIQSIIDIANKLGSVEYIFLEQDESKLDEIESIKKSMKGFKRYSGLEWD